MLRKPANYALRMHWPYRTAALLLIAIAAAFVGYQSVIPGRDDFGISGPSPFAVSSFRATSVEPGSPAARAGIRPGDNITYPLSALGYARAAFATPGSVVTMTVNQTRPVSFIARRQPPPGIPWWVTAMRLAFLFVAALLTWRRPADRAVQALTVFLVCFGFSIALNSGILPWAIASFFVMQIGQPVLIFAGIAAMGVFAAVFPSGKAAPAAATLSRIAVALSAAFIVAAFVFNLLPRNLAILGEAKSFSLLCFVLEVIVVIAIFVVAYVQSPPEERVRRRWLSVMLCVVVAALLADILLQTALGYSTLVDTLTSLPVFALPFGIAYVILRHRVIDLGFVLNKAAVYAVVSVIVVGLFVVLETLLSTYVANQNRITSLSVLIGVSLIIGFSVRYIHDRVDRFIDNVLFRERHAAEAAIRTFAHDASYITDAGVLIQRTLQTLERYAHAEGAGVWLVHDGSGYRPASSTFRSAPTISENDPAIVSMRARGVDADLLDAGSELPGVIGFPMTARGELLGVISCGAKRDGETYAPDERDALRLLADSVGHALDTIEVRELRRRLQALSAPTPAS